MTFGKIIMRIRNKTKLAFEAVPSHRKYRLRLARYVGMAEAIATYLLRFS